MRIIKKAKLAVNLHTAILPKYRGHGGVWQLINGDDEIGVTLHELTEKFDRGKIFTIERMRVYDTYMLEDINIKLCNLSRKILQRLLNGEFRKPKIPNNDEDAIYWRQRTPEESRINWHLSAKQIFHFVRALSRDSIYAFSHYNSNRFTFKKVTPHPICSLKYPLQPGFVIRQAEKIFVMCANRSVIQVDEYINEKRYLEDGMVLH